MGSPTPLSPKQLTVQGYNGVSLSVWDYGGDGPTLILCHCTGTCARVWDPVVAQLQQSFRVLAVDARGHGDSDKPSDLEAYAWINSGNDLCALVANLHLEGDIYAAGHSSGAAYIAYAQLHQPGIFKKIMLIDGIIAPSIAPLGTDKLSDSARRRRTTFESKAEALERFTAKPPMNTWQPECLEAYVAFGLAEMDDGGLTLKCLPSIEGAVYEHGGAHDAFERLNDLDSTTITLTTGSLSQVRILVELQYKILAQANLHTVENSSHFIPQEFPIELSQLMINAFQTLRT